MIRLKLWRRWQVVTGHWNGRCWWSEGSIACRSLSESEQGNVPDEPGHRTKITIQIPNMKPVPIHAQLQILLMTRYLDDALFEVVFIWNHLKHSYVLKQENMSSCDTKNLKDHGMEDCTKYPCSPCDRAAEKIKTPLNEFVPIICGAEPSSKNLERVTLINVQSCKENFKKPSDDLLKLFSCSILWAANQNTQ